MTDEPEKPRPTLVSIAEKRKARRDEEDRGTLYGLADSLEARAKVAEDAGDHELAIEMMAAHHATWVAINFEGAMLALDMAYEELDKLNPSEV
jgi:hypothetical protein